MRKRLRKKRCVGEFVEWAIEVDFDVIGDENAVFGTGGFFDALDAMLDRRFITMAGGGHVIDGGHHLGFLFFRCRRCVRKRRPRPPVPWAITEADRAYVLDWLTARSDVRKIEAKPDMVDINGNN